MRNRCVDSLASGAQAQVKNRLDMNQCIIDMKPTMMIILLTFILVVSTVCGNEEGKRIHPLSTTCKSWRSIAEVQFPLDFARDDLICMQII